MSVTVRVPKGARWDCHSCGACCRLYDLGPVEPEIIEGLKERHIEEHWAPAAERPWYEVRRAPDGTERFFLTSVEGHCVFLRDDNLCAVHGLFGAAAKPAFCREFPFHFVRDPKGIVAVVRPTCAGFHASSVDGQPIENHLPEVAALPRMMPIRKFAPETVSVLTRQVPLAEWMELEEQLLTRLDAAPGDPEDWVAGWRDVLVPGKVPEAGRAPMAANAVLEGIRRLLSVAVTQDGDAHRRAFARSSLDLVEAALGGTPAALSEETRTWVRLLLRSFLLAKSFVPYGGVAEGLGGFLLQVRVLRTAAGVDPVPSARAGEIVVKWNKLVDHPAVTRVFGLARPALADLWLHTGPVR